MQGEELDQRMMWHTMCGHLESVTGDQQHWTLPLAKLMQEALTQERVVDLLNRTELLILFFNSMPISGTAANYIKYNDSYIQQIHTVVKPSINLPIPYPLESGVPGRFLKIKGGCKVFSTKLYKRVLRIKLLFELLC